MSLALVIRVRIPELVEPSIKGEPPVVQMVKNLPTVQETRVGSLGWEDLLEKGKATHSSIFSWRIP